MQLRAAAFSFVMATGILSVGAALQGFEDLSRALLALTAVAYVALVTAVRTDALRERTFAPFAFVAATGVLGTRLAVADRPDAALALGAVAVAAWIALALRRPPSPAPATLLAVVATEALAVLGAAVARGETARPLLLAALAWWALGLALYPLVVAIVLRRRPRFEPELWVLMGALAIATLAASQLVTGARALGGLAGARRAVEYAGLVTWAVATVLIPVLAAADVARRTRWRYSTGRWSFVFPLGMYATASQTLGNAVGRHALVAVGRAFLVVALLAWATVAVGLVRRAPAALRRFHR